MATSRTRLALVFALALAAVVIVGPPEVSPSPFEGTEPDRLETVEPRPGGGTLWPYTSKRPSVGSRTLPINVIIHGDPGDVRRYLVRRAAGDWRRPTDGAVEPINEAVPWRRAHGATRYTYAGTHGRSGTWVTERYQLQDGDYLGTRYHLRAYTPPGGGEWTAIQAHREYWDWFRLRHTVTSIDGAQRHVESRFVVGPGEHRVRRIHLDNGDAAHGDGWATVIELAGAGTLGAALSIALPWRSFRRNGIPHAALLFGSMIAVVLGVRIGGVFLERALPAVPPQAIAALLYPVMAIAVPAGAYVFARTVDAERAFLLATTGVAVALFLDVSYLRLSVLPVDIVLHRVAVALAPGLIAAGSSHRAAGGPRWNEVLVVGIAGWIVALLLPLSGWV